MPVVCCGWVRGWVGLGPRQGGWRCAGGRLLWPPLLVVGGWVVVLVMGWMGYQAVAEWITGS